ncbi:DUF3842 family protein [Dethiosulfatarculus sandiegensis]|uniref:DUF3842 family protein n=1 Tax=Dethiosulfatarculus sandiegensis TaxID=1429043 RepID=A0A0D2J6K0_9BACT|nr:DUF3842 family protein [Dethiosulfatarculus sandiegensis]KIX11311.1 hypothetical protein X474_23620 [Dethiosulfatarculus sandiegensis]
MRISVIDGQGGGIGALVIKRFKEEFGEAHEILALGTNAIATTQMMKAGANKGATGESAIVATTARSHVIIGPVGIVLAGSMMGEVTGEIAVAIASSDARKFLLPLTQENVEIVGVKHEPLPHLVDQIIKGGLKEYLKNV